MNPTAKQRFPRAEAVAVAKQLCDAMKPACERIVVAGSLRRGKSTVGDVEILYIPTLQDRPSDLFTTRPVAIVDDILAKLIEARILEKRLNAKGVEMWGNVNKFARHVASGIPVDLFATTHACWANYLVCRTGSAAMNRAIAEAAIARRWKWNPYGPGFTDELGETRKVTSEQEVFELVGLRYRNPWER